MTALENILDRLQSVKKSGDGWEARCPAHDDRHASLSVGEGEDGRVLLKCHAGAGCSPEAITTAVGLRVADLFERDGTVDAWPRSTTTSTRTARCSSRSSARSRRTSCSGALMVAAAGSGSSARPAACSTGSRICSPPSRPDAPSMWSRVRRTCTHSRRPVRLRPATRRTPASGAIRTRGRSAAPTSSSFRTATSKGASMAKVVASLLPLAKSVLVVEAAEGKDAADHLAAGRSTDEFVPVEPEDPEKPNSGSEPAPLSEKPFRQADLNPAEKPALADEVEILAELRADLRRAGLAGEQRGAQITYLALTSRVLPWGKPTNRPVSAIGKGTTSTGKSYTQRTVLRFFPEDAYVGLGSMSKRYLLYTDESLEHRFIIVPEWSSIANDEELVASLRTLLSEGRLIHGTVDGDGRRQARRIEKAGPTGLLMTTTHSSVDSELETRCLSFLTDDTPAQTRRVFKVLAELENEDELAVDFARWHALQRWIADAGERRVVIPYVRQLAELMPDGATRLRRDFVSMLCLVRAHAVLHQATRERDEHGGFSRPAPTTPRCTH